MSGVTTGVTIGDDCVIANSSHIVKNIDLHRNKMVVGERRENK